MAEQSHPNSSSPDTSVGAWTWIILAGLLVLGAIVGVGTMAIMSMNQQAQTATGSQTVPSSR